MYIVLSVSLLVFVHSSFQFQRHGYDYAEYDFNEYSPSGEDYGGKERLFRPERLHRAGRPVPATPNSLQDSDIQEGLQKIMPHNKEFFHIPTKTQQNNFSSKNKSRNLTIIDDLDKRTTDIHFNDIYTAIESKGPTKRISTAKNNGVNFKRIPTKKITKDTDVSRNNNVKKTKKITKGPEVSRTASKEKTTGAKPRYLEILTRSPHWQKFMELVDKRKGIDDGRSTQSYYGKTERLTRSKNTLNDTKISRTRTTVHLSSRDTSPTRSDITTDPSIIYEYILVDTTETNRGMDIEYSGELVIPTTATIAIIYAPSRSPQKGSHVPIHSWTEPLHHPNRSTHKNMRSPVGTTRRKLPVKSSIRRLGYVPGRSVQMAIHVPIRSTLKNVTNKSTMIYEYVAPARYTRTRTRQNDIKKLEKGTKIHKHEPRKLMENLKSKLQAHRTRLSNSRNIYKTSEVTKNIDLDYYIRQFVNPRKQIQNYSSNIEELTRVTPLFQELKLESTVPTTTLNTEDTEETESELWKKATVKPHKNINMRTNTETMDWTESNMQKQATIVYDYVPAVQTTINLNTAQKHTKDRITTHVHDFKARKNLNSQREIESTENTDNAWQNTIPNTNEKSQNVYQESLEQVIPVSIFDNRESIDSPTRTEIQTKTDAYNDENRIMWLSRPEETDPELQTNTETFKAIGRTNIEALSVIEIEKSAQIQADDQEDITQRRNDGIGRLRSENRDLYKTEDDEVILENPHVREWESKLQRAQYIPSTTALNIEAKSTPHPMKIGPRQDETTMPSSSPESASSPSSSVPATTKDGEGPGGGTSDKDGGSGGSSEGQAGGSGGDAEGQAGGSGGDAEGQSGGSGGGTGGKGSGSDGGTGGKGSGSGGGTGDKGSGSGGGAGGKGSGSGGGTGGQSSGEDSESEGKGPGGGSESKGGGSGEDSESKGGGPGGVSDSEGEGSGKDTGGKGSGSGGGSKGQGGGGGSKGQGGGGGSKGKGSKEKKRPATKEVITTPGFDVDMFLELLANLTYDYDTNLTMVMNMTLKERGAPTCGTPRGWYAWMGWPNFTWPTTSTTTTTTEPPPPKMVLNNTVIAKCFVCGLKDEGIPFNADCADSFAGDFLPLTPINPLAKAKASSYRKYCRYGEIYNYHENVTRPKSIYGRWTGGCSVRWTDLTGLYTQRACRNKRRPTTGAHYASKRMAKLEFALSSVDNGCIITPAATLIPMSRGISLYARFHACVCSGSWCNMAVTLLPHVAVSAVTAVAIAGIWTTLKPG